MNSVFEFDGLSLSAESGARRVQSSTGTSVGLFATTPLSALSGSTGGVGWLVLNYLCVEK
jgi:hypothetical protein